MIAHHILFIVEFTAGHVRVVIYQELSVLLSLYLVLLIMA